MNKPIVEYVGEATRFVGHALLVPTNHPNPSGRVSNAQEVITSKGLSWDGDGRIETENTIYIRAGYALEGNRDV